MEIRIALAGNPNSGKTTLFNSLTGSTQYVGNWPGVTVEKKEGKLKGSQNVKIVDLPGIYSLSPYTLEEVVARNYLLEENPEVILNIIDGTNLERNLYLTTQLIELGIPVVVAINMKDILEKNGDFLDINLLSTKLDSPVVEISALKGTGIEEAANTAIKLAKSRKKYKKKKFFIESIEAFIKVQEETTLKNIPLENRRWFAVKLFERDKNVLEQLELNKSQLENLEKEIKIIEDTLDDDSESIITDARYNYVASILEHSYIKKNKDQLTISDKIDKIVTNRILALPIFALVMFFVYYISVTTVGGWCTDFINDGVFGDGWFLFGSGRSAYEQALEDYNLSESYIDVFETEASYYNLNSEEIKDLVVETEVLDVEGEVTEIVPVTYTTYKKALEAVEPNPFDYGTFIPGIPVLVQNFLETVNCAAWLQGLILDGIIAGVGGVLGFVPQIFVLFFILSFLETCGYMTRVAFVLDKIFRKFGLSGKSFIPMLIGTGCGVPGIMASRTIESEADRRMTIITTTFIPCSAKLPIIALIAGALFAGAWWVAPTAYLLGALAIIISGIILKKTTMFSGEPAPFVMELPPYHLPSFSTLWHSTWERGWSFVKKAGTIILLAAVFIWFLSSFGIEDGHFGMVDMNNSILAAIGSTLSFIFAPLGWGHWQGTVATITGLVAKENIVGTFGVLFGGFEEVSENGWQIWHNLQAVFSPLAAFSFLTFNLLCAPCFAAIGAIRREMNSRKWTLFAVLYQTVFAYATSLVIYQLGAWFIGEGNIFGTIVSLLIIGFVVYMLFKPYKESSHLSSHLNIRTN